MQHGNDGVSPLAHIEGLINQVCHLKGNSVQFSYHKFTYACQLGYCLTAYTKSTAFPWCQEINGARPKWVAEIVDLLVVNHFTPMHNNIS